MAASASGMSSLFIAVVCSGLFCLDCSEYVLCLCRESLRAFFLAAESQRVHAYLLHHGEQTV